MHTSRASRAAGKRVIDGVKGKSEINLHTTLADSRPLHSRSKRRLPRTHSAGYQAARDIS